MIVQKNYAPLNCLQCIQGAGLAFDFTMAFQPIVDLETKSIFAQEALIRGLNNEPAGMILGQVNEGNRYRFDQACRVKAVQLAAQLGVESYLSINFLPNAIYRPETCIQTTLEAAREFNFPARRIIFEVTEGEEVVNHDHLLDILRAYRHLGFKTAMDDFGAGYSGLSLLADFQPDFVKLDMALVRGVDTDGVRQAIVRSIVGLCQEVGCQVIAEGIETYAEFMAIRELGIHLCQGYYFAKPAFRALANVPVEVYEG